MNIRTNLRKARKESTFIIKVSLCGINSPNQYIHAIYFGQTTTHYATKSLFEAEAKFVGPSERLYMIPFDQEHGITTPTTAVAEATNRFEAELDNIAPMR